MTSLGEITYNALGNDYLSKYPQLANGYIQFSFSTSEDSYTMIIFYNQMAESLFYSIYNSKNEGIQFNTLLATYPQNLLWQTEFIEYAMFYKDNKIYFGMRGEEL